MFASTLNQIDTYAKSPLKYSSKKIEKITHMKKVTEILGWFEGGWFYDTDYGKTIVVKVGGYDSTYSLVTNKKINTMKKLKKYMGKYLTKKKIKKLLSSKMFIEKKGKLYFIGGDRGGRIDYLRTEYKIVKQTKKLRKIKVLSYYGDNWDSPEGTPIVEREEVTFYYQKKVNGKWKFDKITLPY